MLKLEKSQYLNSFFQLNYTRYDKVLLYKIVYYKKIYKPESPYFFYKMYIFLFNLKNTIENRKFKFLTIMCEIQKKR